MGQPVSHAYKYIVASTTCSAMCACYIRMYKGLLCYFVLKSPFNGEDEDELFEAICSDSPQYPRWLNKHTLNLIDRVSEDGVKD